MRECVCALRPCVRVCSYTACTSGVIVSGVNLLAFGTKVTHLFLLEIRRLLIFIGLMVRTGCQTDVSRLFAVLPMFSAFSKSCKHSTDQLGTFCLMCFNA